jgi:hypothetical protein
MRKPRLPYFRRVPRRSSDRCALLDDDDSRSRSLSDDSELLSFM